MPVGRTITKVRWMTKEEMDKQGWYSRAAVLELDNGDYLYASQDEEGNGPGALFGSSLVDEDYIVIPDQEA